MIVALPVVKQFTSPVPELTVATVVALLDHTPPPAASESVIVADVQPDDGPVIVPALGNGLTVIAYVAVAVPQEAVIV